MTPEHRQRVKPNPTFHLFFQVEDNLPTSQQRVFNGDLLPSAPGSPKALNITNSNVTLAWPIRSTNAPSPDKSRSSSLTYTIEQFCLDDTSSNSLPTAPSQPDGGWEIALRHLAGNTATVTGLRPDTSYLFVVRAENAYGCSVPSVVSVPIRTLSSDDRVTVPAEMESARNVLSGKVSHRLCVYFEVFGRRRI